MGAICFGRWRLADRDSRDGRVFPSGVPNGERCASDGGVWRTEVRAIHEFSPRGGPRWVQSAWDGGGWRTGTRGMDEFSPAGSQMGSDVLRTVAFGGLRLEGSTFPPG